MRDEDQTTATWQPNPPPEIEVARIQPVRIALWIVGLLALCALFGTMIMKAIWLMVG